MTRLGATILLALCAGCGGGAREVPLWERPGLYGAERPEMGSPQPGDVAPDFDVPLEGGATFHGARLRGSWVVLHFTASWCPYCDAEVEHLGKLATDYGPRGVKVALVDIQEDEARWASYAKAHVSPDVLALRDGSGDVARRFAPPRAQPSFANRAQVMLDATLILDPAGRIRLFLFPDSKHFDPTFAAVRRELDALVGPGPAPPADGVVSVDARAEATPAGEAELVVVVRVAPGYHLMSDHPSAPQYVATRVALDPADGVTWGEPRYPSPVAFALAGRSIATFRGDVPVRVPFRTAPGTKRSVTGAVRYQACSETTCSFPATRTFAAEVRGE